MKKKYKFIKFVTFVGAVERWRPSFITVGDSIFFSPAESRHSDELDKLSSNICQRFVKRICTNMTILTEETLDSLRKIVWGDQIREDVFQRWAQGCRRDFFGRAQDTQKEKYNISVSLLQA